MCSYRRVFNYSKSFMKRIRDYKPGGFKLRFVLVLVLCFTSALLASLSWIETTHSKVALATTGPGAGATSIQSLLEQSAVGKPHVAAILRAISQSLPTSDGSGQRRMG